MARAWVFIIPLTLYAAWWLWALQFDNEGTIMAVNVWLIPASRPSRSRSSSPR